MRLTDSSSRWFRILISAGSFAFAAPGFATTSDELPTWPNDFSRAGMSAAIHNHGAEGFEAFLPEGALEQARAFARETRSLGLSSRSGSLRLTMGGPPNVRANDPTGDAVGETQSEVSVAVHGDTVVIGWNDSKGFLADPNPAPPNEPPFTLSSYAYSTDGGATFTDGGNVPRLLPTDQVFGDTGLDTDDDGNWYLVGIYTRAAGFPNALAEQNIAVHHGRFNGSGVLVWDPPTFASISNGGASGALDKCLLAADRLTGNVYAAWVRLGINPTRIEIARSINQGLSWDPPVLLDNTVVPTGSKTGVRPMCGPLGQVYVVWEKGANTINCPNATTGVVTNTTGVMAFTKSIDFGVTYDPFISIGTVDHSWTWSGPGDNRERANEFPDIAVDRSGGTFNGNLYVTWHESAPWSANLSPGPAVAEANDAANNSPSTPDLFAVGDNVAGTISGTADLDYWRFSATQGQTILVNVDPAPFNCGVTGTANGIRLRLYATQSPYPLPAGSFPDSMLAASSLGGFAQRICWTAPQTGDYLLRLQRSAGAASFAYSIRARDLTVGAPNPARDMRDIVAVRSTDGGASWSAEQLINDDAPGLENRRPFLAADGLGHVHAFWHDSRVPGFFSNAALVSVFGTTSRDGGVTWSSNYGVTDELSFFSFNTLAIPNLGDYNQAAANADCVFPAWSDQRISTGDVRNPTPPPTYTAGRGPDAYTTKVCFDFSLDCPPSPILVQPATTATVVFCARNTGTVPDIYDYKVTDTNAWLVFNQGAVYVAAGDSFCVRAEFNVPYNCLPPSTIATFSVTPEGDPDGERHCDVVLNCDGSTATTISRFEARSLSRGVELLWTAHGTGDVLSFNVYRGQGEDGVFTLVNAEPILMGPGGDFRLVDDADLSGTWTYRLAGLGQDGRETVLQTLSARLGAPRDFEFALAGPNPFRGGTRLRYALPQRSPVRVEVYTVAGRRVATLVDRVEEAGEYSLPFALRSGGRSLGAGLYLVRITAGKDRGSLRVVAFE